MIVYYASIDKLLMLTTTTDLQFFRTYYKKNWQDSRATSTYITLHVSMTSPQPKSQKNVTQQTFMVLCLLVQIPFFFYLDFLSQPFTNHRTAGKRGGQFLLAINAESSPLHIGSSQTQTGLWFPSTNR